MAIIYTYPTIDTIEGGDLFLVSDVSEENATRKVTAAEFGGYIQATYGPGTNMYQADGSLTGNRIITGAGFGLAISGVNQFIVNSTTTTHTSTGDHSINADDVNIKPSVTGKLKIGNNFDGSELDIQSTLKYKTASAGLGKVATSDADGFVSWEVPTTGTVTNVATAGTVNGLTLTGGPITTTGTVTLGGTLAINNSDWVGTSLAIANGGTGASTAQDGINELTLAGGATNEYVLTKDTATGNAIWKFNPGLTVASTLYNTSDVVGSGRVATVADTLTWNGGSVRRTANLTAIIEVTQESDFGTPVAGVITLPANTTYQVIGSVTCSNRLVVSAEGVSIMGNNRQLDKLVYSGTGDFITITDVNFTINDVWLSATNASSLLIRASNVAASGFNNGRTRVFEIVNCQFRNCYNVMDINGFDLVDISNTLFFYIQAPSIGLRFRDTSKIEISSCELIRWYDETTNGTANPPGWATCSMIELRANNFASFGAVNINGCIIHPQETQNGIDIGTGSTTGFGTISSSAFINTGLTGGRVLLANGLTPALGAYSSTEALTYDVFSNQGLLNSTSGTVMTINGNTTATSLSAVGGAVPIDTGGLALEQAGVRYTVSTVGRATYNGTKQVYVSLHASISYEKQGAGVDPYAFYFYKNGVLLTGSISEVTVDDEASSALSMVYGTLMNQNDYIEIYVEVLSGNDDMLIKDLQLVIRE